MEQTNDFHFPTKEDKDSYAQTKSIVLDINKENWERVSSLGWDEDVLKIAPFELRSAQCIEQRLRKKIKSQEDLYNFKFEVGIIVLLSKYLRDLK